MIAEMSMVDRILRALWAAKVWKDSSGQDMLEYALYVAVIGTLYAAVSPSVATSVSSIFSKISSSMSSASTTS